jgi:hypothetical protein
MFRNEQLRHISFGDKIKGGWKCSRHEKDLEVHKNVGMNA